MWISHAVRLRKKIVALNEEISLSHLVFLCLLLFLCISAAGVNDESALYVKLPPDPVYRLPTVGSNTPPPIPPPPAISAPTSNTGDHNGNQCPTRSVLCRSYCPAVLFVTFSGIFCLLFAIGVSCSLLSTLPLQCGCEKKRSLGAATHQPEVCTEAGRWTVWRGTSVRFAAGTPGAVHLYSCRREGPVQSSRQNCQVSTMHEPSLGAASEVQTKGQCSDSNVCCSRP